jgi:hypothetical protein
MTPIHRLPFRLPLAPPHPPKQHPVWPHLLGCDVDSDEATTQDAVHAVATGLKHVVINVSSRDKAADASLGGHLGGQAAAAAAAATMSGACAHPPAGLLGQAAQAQIPLSGNTTTH